MRNRIGLSLTVYNQDIDNLAFNRPLPLPLEAPALLANAGAMNNKGIELLLTAQPVRNANFSGTWV
ncbi:MAG: TonB-dependent receptor [Lewinellaceae bacterium]|nr:TonB-dependent receptor [Lewinellaceae bacterium]